jgi:hypothetical protein
MENHLTNKNTKEITFQSPVDPINYRVITHSNGKKGWIGILGLLDLLHFGRGHYARGCVKQLSAVTHGSDIWLDNIISIDVKLIANITGLTSWGMDSM